MNYIATITQENKKLFFARVHEYDWAYAQGTTLESAKQNLQEVIMIGLNNKDSIKKPLSLSEVTKLEEIDEYRLKFPKYIYVEVFIDETKVIKNFNKAIRTNVTIKSGLKELAKQRGINISELLNKALSSEILK